ncbi:hypothetical protein C942_03720 [Photobacterium marinum]|uniref:Uncharacterized protein n=1 Tax=Photobacterium marinum TaxID=1056511 RepID=L8JHY4_9GAMM|nr:hypothetical protein C942_03720 [Photobacterium marinum]
MEIAQKYKMITKTVIIVTSCNVLWLLNHRFILCELFLAH